MEYATIIVMLALAEYIYFTGRVGASREKLGIEAPACTGNDQFERKFRVQQNTLEQLIIFVPATYTFAFYVSELWVWLPGAVFILGRFHYSSAYEKDPSKRTPGMLGTMFANIALVLGTLIAVVLKVV
jgi:uncharacterized membrane protein YecN with MAPEG domain